MAKFAILIRDNGTLYSGAVFRDQDIPEEEFVPVDANLLVIEDTRPDYAFLYAYFVDDINRETIHLKPYFKDGAFVYDFSNNEFVIEAADELPDVLDLVRMARNLRIKQTDDLMLVPDYPSDLRQQLLSYRQALRDITNNPDPSWIDVEQFPWPEKPDFI